MGAFFSGLWSLLQTDMELPWIGHTTPLKMMLFIGIATLLVEFVTSMWGSNDD